MHTFVASLFGKAKVKLTQTPRAVTPFGGLASFIAFLHQRGFAQQVQTHLPWQLTSSNAIPLAHTFTAFVVGVITGARRFAHTEQARSDRALHTLLGVPRWPGADTVRGLFHRFTQATIQQFWRPLWVWLLGMVLCPAAGWSLDLDSTVFQRAGHQQGAAKGYNPAGLDAKAIIRSWRCWPKPPWCCTGGCAAATPVRPAVPWPFSPKRWPCCRRA